MKLYFLSLLLIVSSTWNFSLAKENVTSDSIQYYYSKSRNKFQPKEDRIKFISRVIELSSLNKRDSMFLKGIAYKSTILGQGNDYQQAIKETRYLLDEAVSLKDKYYEAIAYEKLGRYHRKIIAYEESFAFYQKAKIEFEKLNRYDKVVRISKRIANIQLNVGDYSGAEITAVEGLKSLKIIDNDEEVVWLNDIIAKAYQSRNLYDEAIKYHKKAISIELSNKSKATLFNNYAVTLIKNERYHEAIKILEGALLEKGIKSESKNRFLDNIAVAKGKLKDPKAEKLFLDALQMRIDDGDIEGTFASTIHLTEYFTDRFSLIEAKRYAIYALKIADSIKSPDAKLEALQWILKTKGQITKKEFAVYNKLRDSLDNVQKDYAYRFATIKFNYDEEKLIAQKAKLDAQKSTYQKQIAFIVTLAILGLSILLFFMQRQRSKRKQLETRYNTETQISKKVHDVLANDMFSIRSELALQSISKNTLNKLDDLYERTRDISKEMSTIPTDVRFFESLSYMLRGMLSQDTKLIIRGSDNISWDKISKQTKITLYRTLQELMVNMKKHSNANAVVIAFAKAKHTLSTNYQDNGSTHTNETSLGSGLQNVENRIHDIGGSFTFELKKEDGCSAQIILPV